VAVVVVAAVVAATMETLAAVRETAKANPRAAVDRQTARLETTLRPHLANRVRVAVTSAATRRAGLSRSLVPKRPAPRHLAPKRLMNMRLVNTRLASIRASRPRLPRRSRVNLKLRDRPHRAVARSSPCGVRRPRAVAAPGADRARVAKSNRAHID
jgi:hypothetical protein